MRDPVRWLAALLVAGIALMAAGAAAHPMLVGTADAELRTISATPAWRTIHLAMLAGSICVIGGIWVRSIAGPATPALGAALTVVSLGLAMNALDIAFMASAGTHMAAAYAAGDTAMAAIFDATHLTGLMTARFGNGVTAVGAALLGVAESRAVGQPRWLAWLAWAAAVGGAIGVLAFDESSRLILGAVAILPGWELATAIRVLRSRSPRHNM
jgi:hypothetical protein